MRSLFLLFVCASAFGQTADPILAIPITHEFLNDPVIRGYFADLLRQGGYGRRDIERAAFIIKQEDGEYRCLFWPFSPDYRQQQYRGTIPDRTMAIVHTHPLTSPEPSIGDDETARRLCVPIFVITPLNIYLVTSRGENRAMIKDHDWASDVPPVGERAKK